jgi:pyridoxamine 5'-phosphate oxidase
MALASVNSAGIPSVRIVLLKHFAADASDGPEGFCWYTDYRSLKGAELTANPAASAVFYWRDFDRQVRITGTVSRVDTASSQNYFDSRPLDSRFSAAASEQSARVADRQTLEDRVAALRARYPQGDVPRPADWGGFRLQPSSIEFWQGREGRLHDRFLYTKAAGAWSIERLQP